MPKKKESDIKTRHRLKLLEYLSNPENEDISKSHLSIGVIGYADVSGIYGMFTPKELNEIFAEALIERRSQYATLLFPVDAALFKAAKAGDPKAIKLIYQRFEGWSEKQIVKHGIEGTLGGMLAKMLSEISGAPRGLSEKPINVTPKTEVLPEDPE